MYGRGRCSSIASFRSAVIQTKRFAEQRNLLARHCRTWRRNRECWRQVSIHTGSARLVQFSVFNARSFPQFGELSVTHSSERVAFSPALFKPRLAIQPDASSSEKLKNISSDGLPSSTAHTGQTGARGPSGQSVLVLLGSREQCLEFPLIGTKRTSLRHVAAYNVSRMSAFRGKADTA
jgi:hypothetical protein